MPDITAYEHFVCSCNKKEENWKITEHEQYHIDHLTNARRFIGLHNRKQECISAINRVEAYRHKKMRTVSNLQFTENIGFKLEEDIDILSDVEVWESFLGLLDALQVLCTSRRRLQ